MFRLVDLPVLCAATAVNAPSVLSLTLDVVTSALILKLCVCCVCLCVCVCVSVFSVMFYF